MPFFFFNDNADNRIKNTFIQMVNVMRSNRIRSIDMLAVSHVIVYGFIVK